MAPKKDAKIDAKIVVVMGDKSEKKSVVRYNNSDTDTALTSLYVSKAALAKLGNPDEVEITIKAAP